MPPLLPERACARNGRVIESPIVRSEHAALGAWRLLLIALPGCTATCARPPSAGQEIIHATPVDYLEHASTLRAGDTLLLEPGDYTEGLHIEDVEGDASHPVIIRGPDTGPPPRFVGAHGEATIMITDSSHLVLRRLELDG